MSENTAGERPSWALEPKDIEWTMDWGSDHLERYKKAERYEQTFEKEKALAHLLMNDVVFLNSHWWEEEWPEAAKAVPSINVNCNDLFAWACADAEELPYSEIENLYRMWRADPVYGHEVWCLKRRNMMPQPPVERSMRKAGIDLDALKLGENTKDAEVQAIFKAFCASRSTAVTPDSKPENADRRE